MREMTTDLPSALGLLAMFLSLAAGSPATAEFEEELQLNGVVPFARFGSAVALSGDTVAIGAPDEDCAFGFWCGAVEVWVKSDPVWSLEASLLASPPAQFQRFGTDVALSGDHLAVSIPNLEVYLFERIDGVWTETAVLSEIVKDVALDGDTLVVGGAFDVAVYLHDGVSWIEQARLTPGDGESSFGSSVALSGDRAIIGAEGDDHAGSEAGSAYVFDRLGSLWSETIKLTASDAGAGDLFGCDVAIDGPTVLIGTNCAVTSTAQAGYVYEDNGGVWEEQILTPTDSSAGFGSAVAIDGTRALVGAWNDGAPNFNPGAAYLFEPVDGVWLETQKLTASTGAMEDELGFAVDLEGSTAVAGAPGDDSPCDSFDCGAAFVYEETAPPLILNVSGPCPGLLTIEITGATANQPVAFLLSPNPGSFEIPAGATCAGLIFDLDQPRLVGLRSADALGEVLLFRNVPANLCGQLLQAADGTSCTASNVAVLPVED